jgi:hypothetical protein
MAASSRFTEVGVMPMCSSALMAKRCGPVGAPVSSVLIDSIDSSIDMPRPSNRLATNTAPSAALLRDG